MRLGTTGFPEGAEELDPVTDEIALEEDIVNAG
jgi:hypothetical protein